MSTRRLTPAREASSTSLAAAAKLLHRTWPRNSIETYEAQLVQDDSSFLLLENGNFLGHARLVRCSRHDAAVTYVVVEQRGLGHGRQLMEKLQDHALSVGYEYLYLWTANAVGFYRKLGYLETKQRVTSCQRPCFQRFEYSQIQSLERHLGALRRWNDAMDRNKSDVWMRRRLRETVPLQPMDSATRIVQLEQDYDSYHLHIVNWQRQVGPSCGLACLRMLADESEDSVQGLLATAQECGYSTDGEVYNIFHLDELAKSIGLNTQVVEMPTFVQFQMALAAKTATLLFVLPYDADPATKFPTCCGGEHAHYGLVVGTTTTTNAGLILQQGLSQNLIVAEYGECVASNLQLRQEKLAGHVLQYHN